jgi:hypothetical protein
MWKKAVVADLKASAIPTFVERDERTIKKLYGKVTGRRAEM